MTRVFKLTEHHLTLNYRTDEFNLDSARDEWLERVFLLLFQGMT